MDVAIGFVVSTPLADGLNDGGLGQLPSVVKDYLPGDEDRRGHRSRRGRREIRSPNPHRTRGTYGRLASAGALSQSSGAEREKEKRTEKKRGLHGPTPGNAATASICPRMGLHRAMCPNPKDFTNDI